MSTKNKGPKTLATATSQSSQGSYRKSTLLGDFPEPSTPDQIKFDVDGFEVPVWIQNDIRAAGFNFKWINKKKYYADGFHKRGWEPYKLSKEALESRGKDSRLNGFDPEGYFVRNDNILAIRSNAVDEAYKSHLASLNERMAPQSFKNAKMTEFKERLAEAGLKKESASVSDDVED